MQADLDISPEMWGWVVGMFSIAYAAFAIPSGALGDRIGQRKVLTFIVVWWSLFTFLLGSARKLMHLLVLQFLFGAGEAGGPPNTAASISRWFPSIERGRASGIVWMATRLGGVLAPLIVIAVQLRWGWRASFYLFAAIGLLWAFAWWIFYRDSPRQIAAVTKDEVELIEGGAAATVTTGAKAKQTLPWSHVVRSTNFWSILVMYHAYCWGAYFFTAWLHTYLAKGRDFTPAELALWSPLPFALGALANLGGGFSTDRLVKKIGLKWGRRAVGMIGLGSAAIFTLSAAIVEGKIACVILLSLAFAGSDFMMPAAWSTCMDVGKKFAGSVSGAMNTAGQAGSFISVVVFGYLVSGFGSYNAPLVPMGAMLVLATLLWLRIDPTESLVPEEKAQPVQTGV